MAVTAAAAAPLAAFGMIGAAAGVTGSGDDTASYSGWTPLGCEITNMTEDLQWTPATTVSTTCTENALVARVCDLDVTDVAPARGGRVSDNRVSIWGEGEVMLQQYGTAITASSWTLTCPSPWASHSITLDQSDVSSLFSDAALPPDLAARLDAA